MTLATENLTAVSLASWGPLFSSAPRTPPFFLLSPTPFLIFTRRAETLLILPLPLPYLTTFHSTSRAPKIALSIRPPYAYTLARAHTHTHTHTYQHVSTHLLR